VLRLTLSKLIIILKSQASTQHSSTTPPSLGTLTFAYGNNGMSPLMLHNVMAATRSLRREAALGMAMRVPTFSRPTVRSSHTQSPKWRPVSILDEYDLLTLPRPLYPLLSLTMSCSHVSALNRWVAREARPVSLRQLMVFGRSLTEDRLLDSANYVRTELPTR